MTVELARGRIWRSGDGGSDDTSLSVRHAWSTAANDRLRLTLGLVRIRSSDPNREMAGASLALHWDLLHWDLLRWDRLRWDRGWSLFGRASLWADLSASARDSPVFPGGAMDATGREERALGAVGELDLPDSGTFGLLPVPVQKASDTRSNISRYDQAWPNLGFALRSRF